MKFTPTTLADAFIVEPDIHGDARGYFSETFRRDLFDAYTGRHVEFIQDNESMSTQGVLRGLHFQAGEASQAKLVRVSLGEVLDVIVDLRQSSPTFRQWTGVTLSAANHRQLFVPRGFAHGFVVLSDVAVFQYKVDNIYCPEAEHTLRYDDPDIGVCWPSTDSVLLSPKDLQGSTLADLAAQGLLFD